MRIIISSIIPFKGFGGINLFNTLFIRKGVEWDEYDTNHEKIHTAQMKELLYVFFYILYFIEWLFNLIFWPRSAYRHISFEKEAYKHQRDLKYLDTRKHYAQWRHP